jgi:hypothetical protein
MRTKLAIIAVSGFAVSALCLSAAFALGGNAIGNAVFDLGGIDFGGFNQPSCDSMHTPVGAATSRSLNWDGEGDRAAVALPADIHYQAGSGDQLVVKGDPDVIAHIQVHNGVVGLDCNNGPFHLGHDNRVDVTLPGRNFRSFALLGVGSMQLGGLSQPDLKILLAGSGDIRANGATDNLEASVRGSGDMKLGDLVAKNADVSIAGSGDIELAPEESLDVSIRGSGTVTLHHEPKNIDKSVIGSGRIVHADGTVESWPHHEHYERHARADRDGLGAIINEAVVTGQEPDQDEIDAATEKLKQRIRARVAAQIANAPF